MQRASKRPLLPPCGSAVIRLLTSLYNEQVWTSRTALAYQFRATRYGIIDLRDALREAGTMDASYEGCAVCGVAMRHEMCVIGGSAHAPAQQHLTYCCQVGAPNACQHILAPVSNGARQHQHNPAGEPTKEVHS